MMREILFRGKHENGWWEYGYLNQHRGDSIIDHCGKQICGGDYYIRDCAEKIDTGLYGCDYKVDPDTIGQYTGLKDRNGVMIFEGDILDHHVQGDLLVVRGAVEWDDRDGRWAHHLKSSEPSFCLYNPAAYEVIGNIHDNPELLEGGNGK